MQCEGKQKQMKFQASSVTHMSGMELERTLSLILKKNIQFLYKVAFSFPPPNI